MEIPEKWTQEPPSFAITIGVRLTSHTNKRVSQMRAPLAACHEPGGSYDRLLEVLYVFEHKMQYDFIHAPYARIMVF